jgi:hypothetical protein
VTGDEALTALVETLERIRDLVPAAKSARDGHLVLRLAVDRLWITAGKRLAPTEVGSS